MVTYVATEETPWMPMVKEWVDSLEDIRTTWGTSAWTDEWSDARERRWFTRYQRGSTTPASLAAEERRYIDVDIRAILPTIQVPTLVLADSDGEWEVKPETGRFIADRIPGARLVEQSSLGGLHRLHWYARGDPIVQEVERFLAQLRDEEASFRPGACNRLVHRHRRFDGQRGLMRTSDVAAFLVSVVSGWTSS